MSRLNTISDKLDYIAMGKLNAEQMEYICEINQEVNLKDKEIERLNNIINELEEFIEREIELYTIELTEENERKLSIVAPIKGVYKEIYNVLQELKGSDKE